MKPTEVRGALHFTRFSLKAMNFHRDWLGLNWMPNLLAQRVLVINGSKCCSVLQLFNQSYVMLSLSAYLCWWNLAHLSGFEHFIFASHFHAALVIIHKIQSLTLWKSHIGSNSQKFASQVMFEVLWLNCWNISFNSFYNNLTAIRYNFMSWLFFMNL